MVLPQTALLGREECGWLKTVGPHSLHRLLHCLCSSCYTVERPKADCTSYPLWKNTYLYKRVTKKGMTSRRRQWHQMGVWFNPRWKPRMTHHLQPFRGENPEQQRCSAMSSCLDVYSSWWATKYPAGVCSFVIPLYFCISPHSFTLPLGPHVRFPSFSWGCFVKRIEMKYLNFRYPYVVDITMARFIPTF